MRFLRISVYLTGLLTLLMAVAPLAQAAPPDCSKYLSQEELDFANHYVEWLGGASISRAEEYIDPSIKQAYDTSKEPILKAFRAVKDFDRTMIGCQVYNNGSSRTVNISYQWSSHDAWFVGNLNWNTIGTSRWVKGFQITPLPAPLEKLNAFDPLSKGPVQWLFLTFAILVLGTIVTAAVLCLREKGLKRKWLWMIWLLLGMPKFTINWSTGQIGGLFSTAEGGFQVIPGFQLLGVGFVRGSDYAPWILIASVPLGALVYLFTRKSRRTARAVERTGDS